MSPLTMSDLVFVLQGRGLQLVVMMSLEGNREPGADAVVTALDDGEGKLSLDDSFLDAAQHLGVEIDLGGHSHSV